MHSEAFLLRSVAYGEADQVVTLLTRDHGKMSCLSKHSKSSQRRFGSAMQPFSKFEAHFRPRRNGLGFLEGASPLKSWPGLLNGLDRVSAAYRLLELADALEEPGSVHHEFFDVLEEGLAGLSRAEEAEECCLRSEARLLQLSGWAPRLDACVNCRRPAPFRSPRLSLSEGGLLCSDCRATESCLVLGAGAGQALQHLFDGTEGRVSLAGHALRRFVEYQLGKALKTDAFARQMRGAMARD